MKKQVIALAVAAAVAVPAIAQNVQVYGTIDTSVYKLDTGATGVARSYVESSVFSTSNIGIKGSEDLGNGLKASFDFQGDLYADDGTVGKTSTTRTGLTTASTTGNVVFSRSARISVEGTKLGNISVGRFADATDAFHNTAAFGINQFNQIPGSSAGGKNANTLGWSFSPVKGLTLRAERSMAAEMESATAGEGSSTAHNTVGVEYVSGPMTVRVASASEPNASCALTSGSATTTTNACKDTNSVVAAIYDLGYAQVAAVMMNDSSKAKVSSRYQTRNSSTAIGVQVPQGAATYIVNWQKIDGKATTTYAATDVTTTDADDASSLGVGVRYALSKRTSVNAMAFRLTNSQSAKFGRAAAAGSDVKAMAVGLTHSF